MEKEMINKLRKIKHQVNSVYKNIIKTIDFENESLVYSNELEELCLLSKIDEEITDIIYIILDNKNSSK